MSSKIRHIKAEIQKYEHYVAAQKLQLQECENKLSDTKKKFEERAQTLCREGFESIGIDIDGWKSCEYEGDGCYFLYMPCKNPVTTIKAIAVGSDLHRVGRPPGPIAVDKNGAWVADVADLRNWLNSDEGRRESATRLHLHEIRRQLTNAILDHWQFKESTTVMGQDRQRLNLHRSILPNEGSEEAISSLNEIVFGPTEKVTRKNVQNIVSKAITLKGANIVFSNTSEINRLVHDKNKLEDEYERLKILRDFNTKKIEFLMNRHEHFQPESWQDRLWNDGWTIGLQLIKFLSKRVGLVAKYAVNFNVVSDADEQISLIENDLSVAYEEQERLEIQISKLEKSLNEVNSKVQNLEKELAEKKANERARKERSKERKSKRSRGEYGQPEQGNHLNHSAPPPKSEKQTPDVEVPERVEPNISIELS